MKHRNCYVGRLQAAVLGLTIALVVIQPLAAVSAETIARLTEGDIEIFVVRDGSKTTVTVIQTGPGDTVKAGRVIMGGGVESRRVFLEGRA